MIFHSEMYYYWYERRRQYRDLLKKKRENFWQSTVEADRSSTLQLCRSIDQLMGRGHAPVSAAVGALELHQFFDEKVAGVRASTADAPDQLFQPCQAVIRSTDCRWRHLRRSPTAWQTIYIQSTSDQSAKRKCLDTSAVSRRVIQSINDAWRRSDVV